MAILNLLVESPPHPRRSGPAPGLRRLVDTALFTGVTAVYTTAIVLLLGALFFLLAIAGELDEQGP